MIKTSLLLCLTIYLLSIQSAFSDILCKDSVIESITYTNNGEMYFFTSGGYYWYIKERDFPPTDDKAKKLPEPFKKGEAAVYLNSQDCPSSRDGGMVKGEMEIWITESINRANMIMAMDTKKNHAWGKYQAYDKDHCISQAKITWAGGKPVDAMFSINTYDIYFVQNNTYAMVDCNFICKNPDQWGKGKPPQKITDFHTQEAITGAFVKKDRELFVFHSKTFDVLTIKSFTNGKITATKSSESKDIMKDFLKITEPKDCVVPENATTSSPGVPSDVPSDVSPEEVQPSGEGAVKPTEAEEEKKSSSGWILIGLVILVVIIIVVIILIFFMVRSKSESDSQVESNDSKVGSSVDSQVGSKAGQSTTGMRHVSSVRSKMPSTMAKSSAKPPVKSAANPSVKSSANPSVKSSAKSSVYKK